MVSGYLEVRLDSSILKLNMLWSSMYFNYFDIWVEIEIKFLLCWVNSQHSQIRSNQEQLPR